MEDVQKEILEVAAICLFHGGLWFFIADLVHIQGEHNPLPLMSKGENEAEDFEVAIKSKGGDCWHYGSDMIICFKCMLYLMATPMA